MKTVLSNNLSQFFLFLKSKSFLKGFLSVLLFILIFFYSGYALSRIAAYRTVFTVVLGLFSIVLVAYFIFTIRIPLKTSKVKDVILYYLKRIKFDIPLIYVFVIALFSLISMGVSGDFTSTGITNFASIVLTFLAAYGFVKIISFDCFIKTYKKIFPWFCLLSLIFFAIINAFNITHPFLSFSNGVTSYDNYFFVYFRMIGLSNRNASFFWEPATFSLFICIGIIFEIGFCEKKLRYWVLLIYLFSLVSSFSVSGYLLLIFSLIVSMLIMKNDEANKNFIGLIIIVATLIAALVLVVILKPSFISKISLNSKSGSLKTRLYGPYINLVMMVEHPFGVGFSNESTMFLQYANRLGYSYIDAQTCSFGYWMSALGFPGILVTLLPIIALFFLKGIKWPSKICITLLALLYMMAEPIQLNLVFLIFCFYCLQHCSIFYKERCVVPEGDSSSLASRFLGNSNNSIFAKNSFGSFIVKGFAMLVSLFTTSAYISYFADPKGDGILAVWFTILSILTWILVFDLGIGHGLKNKLISAYEEKDDAKIKRLISSSYLSSAIIALLILDVCSVLIWTTNIYSLFNISSSVIDEFSLKMSLWIILLGICLNFVLKLVGNIFESLQKQGLSNLFAILNTLILLIYVSLVSLDSNSSRLIGLSITYLIASTVPLIIATLILFSTSFKKYKPSLHCFSLNDSKAVISLGGLFFIIQICMLLINSTNTIIVQQVYGSDAIGAASQYTYYSKIFNVVIVIAQLFAGPLWAIIAKAKSSGDLAYVKKANKIIYIGGLIFVAIDLLVFAFLPIIFKIWIPEAVFEFSWLTNLVFLLNSVIIMFATLFTAISNGLSKLKYQITGFIVGLALKVILVSIIVILKKNGYSVPWYCVELTTTAAYLPVLILVPIGNKKYLSNSSGVTNNA